MAEVKTAKGPKTGYGRIGKKKEVERKEGHKKIKLREL